MAGRGNDIAKRSEAEIRRIETLRKNKAIKYGLSIEEYRLAITMRARTGALIDTIAATIKRNRSASTPAAAPVTGPQTSLGIAFAAQGGLDP